MLCRSDHDFLYIIKKLHRIRVNTYVVHWLFFSNLNNRHIIFKSNELLVKQKTMHQILNSLDLTPTLGLNTVKPEIYPKRSLMKKRNAQNLPTILQIESQNLKCCGNEERTILKKSRVIRIIDKAINLFLIKLDFFSVGEREKEREREREREMYVCTYTPPK